MSRIVHFEIQGDAPEALAEFYQKVLGWEIASWEGPQKYWLATTGPDKRPGINGALMGWSFRQQPVINTAEVENLDETLKRVESAGGKLLLGPNEIPGIGTHAYCSDPEGIVFGVLQPVADTSG
jgi:predicted enzyme related to lactoylglutathione lyase